METEIIVPVQRAAVAVELRGDHPESAGGGDSYTVLIGDKPMKHIVIISRILLGLTFVVFGLNGFLRFIPSPQSQGAAGQFI